MRSHRRLRRQTDPDLIKGQDEDTHLPEILIAAAMISMHMSIDQKPDLALIQLTDRCENLIGKRGILFVYHHHAVFPDREPDIATCTFQVIRVASHMMGNDFNVAEISLSQRHLRREPSQR